MPDFFYEKQCGGTHVFGLDEAGRGPWCGPVVAACVCWPQYDIAPELASLINDSKKLSTKKREMIFSEIMTSKAIVGIGQASAAEIDEINILQASFLAMKRALDEVRRQGFAPDYVLIDGNRLPDWDIPKQAIIGGDGRSLSIAAASIIAKVTRDRLMRDLAKQYPQYGWDKNAGYGTKVHIEAMKQFGITPHHRRTYAPVAAMMTKANNA